jgi:YbbR domain-containing protein
VGKIIQIKPEVINLTVQGARQEMDALEKNLKAIVDLTDKKAGTYQVEVKVELPSNYHVTKVEPSKVEVIISDNSKKEGSN